MLVGILVVAAALPVRSEALQAHIDALPVIATVGERDATRLVLRGKLSRRRGREMARVARGVYADFVHRFGKPTGGADRPPVDVCLFQSTAEHRRFIARALGRKGESDLGFYLPAERLIVANLGRSVGNLRHEMVHPLVGDGFPAVPAWLNEGIGSLYGTARLGRHGVTFLVNYRLRDVHKAIRAGTLPTLVDMADADGDDVYGDRAMTYYGTARYLLLYLERRGKLSAFYRAMRRVRPTAAHQRALLERFVDYDAFVRWAGKLRYRRR